MIAAPLPDFARLMAHEALGSTNDEAKRLAEDGADAWTVVTSKVQTAGRGRRRRGWSSPAGNLYMSVILRPTGPVATAAQLGFAAALAVGDAISPLLPRPDMLHFKWPNDVQVEGRKIAGILLESAAANDGSALWLVIGIGVNVVSSPLQPTASATCLKAEGTGEATLPELLRGVIVALKYWVEEWERTGFERLRHAWLARARGLGGTVAVRLERESFTGRFVDLEADGALLVETPAGRRRVAAGEVFPVAA
ncbi:MAG TPA: biotin--[acetyl-CoA-carboxylase] ligase [Stellaceae bacterium]|nr:biotin--[acetyl-CoA-carboxylase] ligase [Stellaceae bacterium]